MEEIVEIKEVQNVQKVNCLLQQGWEIQEKNNSNYILVKKGEKNTNLDIKEKINKVYENKLAECFYGEKEMMIEIFKILKKHNIKSYSGIIKKLEEASKLASIITTI